MLLNVKMPTIVGILTFMSMINFVFSRVEYGKSIITSGPGLSAFRTSEKFLYTCPGTRKLIQFCISNLIILMNSLVRWKTVRILISWLLMKPADQDPHIFNTCSNDLVS